MYVRHQLGREVESQAVEWFLNRGSYRLLAKNYRCKQGEIDIVFEEAVSGKTELVFVEVRARANDAMVDGSHSVDEKKVRRLRRAISKFLLEYRGSAKTARLDLLAKDGSQWTHFVNLW